MKKSVVWLVMLMAFFAFSANAQEAKAKITFEKSVHDFGNIKQGDVVKHVFVFKNTGNAPLQLTDVKTTCGCTAPSWPRTAVAPGEKAEITVQFNSAGKLGMQDKVITIYSNADEPQTTVKIRTNILAGNQ